MQEVRRRRQFVRAESQAGERLTTACQQLWELLERGSLSHSSEPPCAGTLGLCSGDVCPGDAVIHSFNDSVPFCAEQRDTVLSRTSKVSALQVLTGKLGQRREHKPGTK